MNNLFSYNTIHTSLIKETRTLLVSLNRPELQNEIALETLYELETILNWAYSKVEIHSIVINSTSPCFSKGLNPKKISNKGIDKILKIREKLFHLHLLMLQAPQVIILDLGEEAHNIGIEVSFGADMRLSSIDSLLCLNNLEIGIPAMHNHQLASSIAPVSKVKSWMTYTKRLKVQSLVESGFLFDCYDSSNRNDLIQAILFNIKTQAPLPRIQTKMIQNSQTIKSMKRSFPEETNMIRAALSSKDWQASNQKHQKAKDIQNDINRDARKMTLIPGGKSEI